MRSDRHGFAPELDQPPIPTPAALLSRLDCSPWGAKAAGILQQDSALAAKLTAALAKIPDYPRTDTATRTQLLPSSADADGKEMIAPSYEPAAQYHNSENRGLEPVWPYGLIGDDSPGPHWRSGPPRPSVRDAPSSKSVAGHRPV